MTLLTRAIAFLRAFPATAPLVAAVDTLTATVTGNLTYVVAEPLVALGAIVAGVSVADGAGWEGYVTAYLIAAARWLTTPRIDTR